MAERTRTEAPLQTRLARRWFETHTYAGRDLPRPRALLALKRSEGLSVAVAIPALDEAATVGRICRSIREHLMERTPLVDDLVVIDGGSTDGTPALAAAQGARVVTTADVLPEFPPRRGKGESLWRSLRATTADIVCWVDADIRNFRPHFVSRLVAPLLLSPETDFVKAYYRRPLAQGKTVMPAGGGRVTELLARPLLNALFPELAAILQPLAGEYAGRRGVLERVPFFTGYSVEVGLLIDLLGLLGLDSIAQVDLDVRIHRNRPLGELTPMAFAIARAILRRAEEWGRLRAAHEYTDLPLLVPDEGGIGALDVDEIERPPVATLARPAVRAAEPAVI